MFTLHYVNFRLLLKKNTMQTKLLFPHVFRNLGWIVFIPGLILGILFLLLEWDLNFAEIPVFAIYQDEMFSNSPSFFVWIKNEIADELISLMIIIGGIFVAFSKEKQEDEFINKIRLESLVWATYINYGILVLAILFVYGMPFLNVLVFNMVTILIIFIIRFNYVLYRTKSESNEK